MQSNCISRIGGEDGKADGEIVLEKIVHALISPPYLKEISWTGKGRQKERKVALCRLPHLIDFVKAMTVKADSNFTDTQFKDKLIYGILKRAPSKYGGKNEDKENVEERSTLSKKVTERVATKSTAISLSTSQPASMQQNQSEQQILNHHPPIGQAPIDNYPQVSQHPINQPPMTYHHPNLSHAPHPPYQPHSFGQYQQHPHQQQQQPYYYGQHMNYNSTNNMPLQTGAAHIATADHPTSPTYLQL